MKSIQEFLRDLEKAASLEREKYLVEEAETDTFTKSELKEYDIRKLQYASEEQNIKERKKYAKHIFYLITCWLAIILLIVFFQAVKKVPFTCVPFELSETVLITLITTTTANIAAYFLVVTKYLFPNSK